MAWNIPGKKNNGSGNRGRNPFRPGGNGGFDGLITRLRDLFKGGGGGQGGGSATRWLVIAAVLWLAFSSFVLVTEQQRGVVLRFGQVSRILQPGPHLKLPWPIDA